MLDQGPQCKSDWRSVSKGSLLSHLQGGASDWWCLRSHAITVSCVTTAMEQIACWNVADCLYVVVRVCGCAGVCVCVCVRTGNKQMMDSEVDLWPCHCELCWGHPQIHGLAQVSGVSYPHWALSKHSPSNAPYRSMLFPVFVLLSFRFIGHTNRLSLILSLPHSLFIIQSLLSFYLSLLPQPQKDKLNPAVLMSSRRVEEDKLLVGFTRVPACLHVCVCVLEVEQIRRQKLT